MADIYFQLLSMYVYWTYKEEFVLELYSCVYAYRVESTYIMCLDTLWPLIQLPWLLRCPCNSVYVLKDTFGPHLTGLPYSTKFWWGEYWRIWCSASDPSKFSLSILYSKYRLSKSCSSVFSIKLLIEANLSIFPHQNFVLYSMQMSSFLSISLAGSTACIYLHMVTTCISVCLFSHIDTFNGCSDCVDRDIVCNSDGAQLWISHLAQHHLYHWSELSKCLCIICDLIIEQRLFLLWILSVKIFL